MKELWKKKQTSRPRISTHEEDVLVRYLQANPFQVALNAIERTNFPGSRPTACRRIKNSHLKNYVAAKKLVLSNEHKQGRIIFALNNFLRENWDVVFTVVFQSTSNRHVRLYRSSKTRYNEEFINNFDRSGRFSVNVWAWLGRHGLGVC